MKNITEGAIVDKGCPYLDSDLRECYTFELTANNLIKAVHYCLGNYKVCEIYMNTLGPDKCRNYEDDRQ